MSRTEGVNVVFAVNKFRKISKPSFETWIKDLKGCWKENTVDNYWKILFKKIG